VGLKRGGGILGEKQCQQRPESNQRNGRGGKGIKGRV